MWCKVPWLRLREQRLLLLGLTTNDDMRLLTRYFERVRALLLLILCPDRSCRRASCICYSATAPFTMCAFPVPYGGACLVTTAVLRVAVGKHGQHVYNEYKNGSMYEKFQISMKRLV